MQKPKELQKEPGAVKKKVWPTPLRPGARLSTSTLPPPSLTTPAWPRSRPDTSAPTTPVGTRPSLSIRSFKTPLLALFEREEATPGTPLEEPEDVETVNKKTQESKDVNKMTHT